MHSQARSLAAVACASPVGEVAQAELAAAVAAKGVDTPVVQAHLGRTAQKNSFPSQSGYLAFGSEFYARHAARQLAEVSAESGGIISTE